MIRTCEMIGVLCVVCLPILVLGAPTDESIKPISGLYRGDAGYWSILAPNSGRNEGSSSPGLRKLEDALHTQYGGGSGGTFHKKFDSLSGRTFGGEKRNFDEIDRAGFGSFVKKNFDEIDRAGFGSFVKKNFDEIDRNGFGFNKKNFDEIDRAGFDSFVKRET